MNVVGIENISAGELHYEIQRGGRFVIFQYCVSLLVITFKRPTSVYFIRTGQNATVKGIPWTLVSLLAGWWGIPWGPIYTVQSIWKNCKGGVDVTESIVKALVPPGAGQAKAATAD